MATWDLDADRHHNRLFLTVDGYVSPGDRHRLRASAVREARAALKRGFTLVQNTTRARGEGDWDEVHAALWGVGMGQIVQVLLGGEPVEPEDRILEEIFLEELTGS